jgi:carboxyl-terminal processing protease
MILLNAIIVLILMFKIKIYMRTQFKNPFIAFFLLLIFMGTIFISCKKDENIPKEDDPIEEPIEEEAPLITQKINEFIKLSMDVYLWEQYLPNIDIRYEFDSKEYFDKLLYSEDKWSFITDDIEALEASFQGVETTFGYSLAFGRFSNTETLFAIVEYVYPNSPASMANLKRGDIILQLNLGDITEENYRELFYGSTIDITLGVLDDGSISEGSKINMTSQTLNLDPVLVTDVIEVDGRKIGYLFYAQYISNYNSSLDIAFQEFKVQGITDLVLDIRYNPGGYISAAQHLCSSLAPQSVVSAQDVLVTLQWNSFYQNYWQTNQVYNQIQMNYVSTPVNLNLSKIYILTGSGSASASELTITGLDPYMDVVLIGDTTYGKYTGSITLKPEKIFTSEPSSYYADFDNWGLQPIVLRYANALGITDFKDGFAPDFYVYDDLWEGIPLGDPTDPLLAKALEQITGIKKVSALKKQAIPYYEIFGRGFSRFDKQKQNLIVDMPKTKK